MLVLNKILHYVEAVLACQVIFPAGSLVTAAKMNQFSNLIRDHTHGAVSSGISSALTRMTAQTEASGTPTSVDFTGIPPDARMVVVLGKSVKRSGTSDIIVQLGDSGGFETTNYLGSTTISSSAVISELHVNGFNVSVNAAAATAIFDFVVILILQDRDTNNWIANIIVGTEEVARTYSGAGSKALSDTLDRIRVTTEGGVNTFDVFKMNALYG